MNLAAQVLEGDRLALARLLTKIENEDRDGLDALAALFPHSGRAQLLGVTGAPGTGKSTLVNRLARHLRSQGGHAAGAQPTVAVVAVDPSSPFSGGAILGDRIRMRDLAGDEGIFIRSMASRGALGGLARATSGVVQALDAAGYDYILIETVGAGQAEVDIARTAHTTIVISAPGMGDEVQAIKAGILEIADILVVNKADLPGAEAAARALRASLEMGRSGRPIGPAGTPSWEVPVLAVIATRGEGIEELAEAIGQHRAFLEESGEMAHRERARIQNELELLLREELARRFFRSHPDGQFEASLTRVLAREISPREAIEELLGGEEA